MTNANEMSQPPPCPSCAGSGHVQTEMYNTGPGQTDTLPETCLECR